jgi:hypothetical protein
VRARDLCHARCFMIGLEQGRECPIEAAQAGIFDRLQPRTSARSVPASWPSPIVPSVSSATRPQRAPGWMGPKCASGRSGRLAAEASGYSRSATSPPPA